MKESKEEKRVKGYKREFSFDSFVPFASFASFPLSCHDSLMQRRIRTFITFSLSLLFSVGLFFACTVFYVVDHMKGSAHFPADCAIVFGTAVWPVYGADGKITAVTAGPGITRRVSTAVALQRKGSIGRIFLSGGKGEGNVTSEAQVMRRVALSLGAKGDSLIVEDQSRSTWENLVNTRPLTSGCKSIVGISDGYHLARIALYADVQGWPVQTYPADVHPDAAFTLRSLLREALGIDLLVLERLSR